MIDANGRPPFEDEDATARLLRTAGPRPGISADRTARVRSAVYRQWRSSARRRTFRRGILAGAALLAMAAGLVLAVRLNRAREDVAAPVRETVATIERVE